jgi:hypothetical protein
VLVFSESKHGPHHRFSWVIRIRVWYQCEVRLAPPSGSFFTVLSGVGIHTILDPLLCKKFRHKNVTWRGPIISEKDCCKFPRSRVD